MPTPLPTPNPYNSSTQLIIRSAYDRCLDLESRHDKVPKRGKLEVLVCARLLGFMLREAPTEEGRMGFASEVVRCAPGDDSSLQRLAELYKDHHLRVFYSPKGRTPTPSLHPFAPSFDVEKEQYKNSILQRTPQSHARAKDLALERDRYHCMLTERTDRMSVEKGLVPAESTPCETRAAHIFDRSTYEGLGDSNKLIYTASASALLERFGQINVMDELNGENVHRLENILTLSSEIHAWFDALLVWLERNPDDPPDTYRPASTRNGYYTTAIPPIVTFTTADSARLPLPDPRYLALHAACARVANMSGAGEYIHAVIREMEETGVLANDGGSDALYHALIRYTDVQVYEDTSEKYSPLPRNPVSASASRSCPLELEVEDANPSNPGHGDSL